MQEAIGFQRQSWYSGACGKYSLQHSLLLLGIPITQKDANKATGVPPVITAMRGTSVPKLKKALKYYDCKPIEIVEKESVKFRKEIDKYLSRGCPIILSVEAGDHWVVLAGKGGKNSYYWIDSADNDIVGYWDWEDIVDWHNEGCDECDGEGIVKCEECGGDGTVWCEYCNGDGCGTCQGRGFIYCQECDGTGEVECEDEDCKYLYGIAINRKIGIS